MARSGTPFMIVGLVLAVYRAVWQIGLAPASPGERPGARSPVYASGARCVDASATDSFVAVHYGDPTALVAVKLVSPADTSVMAPTPDETLTLITCGGTFDPLMREFSNRLVVTAKPVSPDRLGQ